jgi:hypothetical protein
MQLGNVYTTMDREYHDPSRSKDIGIDISQTGSSVAMGIAAGDVKGINRNVRRGGKTGNKRAVRTEQGRADNTLKLQHIWNVWTGQ